MPRQVPPLTNTQVANAKPKAKEYNLADGNGLYLKVKPNKSKIWIFNYQTPITKKRTNISIGMYPSVSIAQARNEREVCREQLARGTDPQHARSERELAQEIAYANTLESIAQSWFAVKSPSLSKGYGQDVWSSLENHVFPKLGSRPIHLLNSRDVIEVLMPLQKADKLELLKRLCQRINMILDHAVITGALEDNRLVRIGKAFKNPTKDHLPSIPPSELPELLNAIDFASIKPVTKALMLWQLHTMVRPSEASGARWAEMDFDSKVWLIPKDRMKRRREHVVPLTPATIELLEIVKPFSGQREFVFPSDINPRKPANSASVNMALKRMGYKGRLVSHGFRSLASTTLNEQGFDGDLIESALAHQDKNMTRAAYNRSDYIERRRELMEAWSKILVNAQTLTIST